ncbi:type II toxin-antitoxin system RelE/ParE family toxin [Aerococcaceae bacterium zg-ZJ1578]|uniref:type II toxin-antitoxin system RelE/ParE family toxin n=1 Tax=Aerococcaceae bacterium zg-252 TaxID=2796928 RepID=UPI001A180BE9|nr:type II toxin-antitoxin system RelE/ParE family toxin [Aerococcaceae bacterium zg-1578]
MERKKYKLTFLPIFEDDLSEVVTYVSQTLQNPRAAYQLVNDIEHAIQKRLAYPMIFPPIKSSKFRKYPYYRINVRNFSVYYVVINDVMEIRRLVYSKRNIDDLLN